MCSILSLCGPLVSGPLPCQLHLLHSPRSASSSQGFRWAAFGDTLSRQWAAAIQGSSRVFSFAQVIALDYLIELLCPVFHVCFLGAVSSFLLPTPLPLQNLKSSDVGWEGRNDAQRDGGGHDGDDDGVNENDGEPHLTRCSSCSAYSEDLFLSFRLCLSDFVSFSPSFFSLSFPSFFLSPFLDIPYRWRDENLAPVLHYLLHFFFTLCSLITEN